MRKIAVAVILSMSFLFLLPTLSAAGGDEWTGGDKALHFGASAAITLLGYSAYKDGLGFSENEAMVSAFITTIAAGTLKEMVDGSFSWKDMGADAAGAGVAIMFLRIEF